MSSWQRRQQRLCSDTIGTTVLPDGTLLNAHAHGIAHGGRLHDAGGTGRSALDGQISESTVGRQRACRQTADLTHIASKWGDGCCIFNHGEPNSPSTPPLSLLEARGGVPARTDSKKPGGRSAAGPTSTCASPAVWRGYIESLPCAACCSLVCSWLQHCAGCWSLPTGPCKDCGQICCGWAGRQASFAAASHSADGVSCLRTAAHLHCCTIVRQASP